jgi:hypothetical protein
MAESPWDDQTQVAARTGRSSGANPYGPPAANAAPAGAPKEGPWQGYDPGYLGKTGGAKPGSGWGYYYADSGRNTGAGALGGLAQSFNYNETGQSDLSKAGMGRAKGLIETGDPDALAAKMYKQRENIAMRAGSAARENELAENADLYAMRGMTGSGGETGAAADIRRKASQARLAALDEARAGSTQWGETAATGRLDAGMPWEGSDLGRRQQNTEWQNRAIDKRTDLAAAAASAAGGGQERIIEIPGYGEVPESMIPYMMEFGAMA